MKQQIQSGERVKLQISGLDEVVQNYEADYYFRNGKHYLLYKENLGENLENVQTRLKFSEDLLELKRSGKLSMELYLEVGKEHVVDYPSAAGVLSLRMKAKKISVEQKENILRAEVIYGLGQGDWMQEDCNLSIEIRK